MSILANPLYRPLFEILRSARNGIVYGGKLRFSHALVINLLYKSGPLLPRMKSVFEATKDHAQVLASFAIIYKIAVHFLQSDAVLGRKNLRLTKFLAGCFGSWIVYSGHFNLFNGGITHQITLYCFSRVLLALGKILLDKYLVCFQPSFINYQGDTMLYKNLNGHQQRKLKNLIYNKSWKYFAIITWGLVMFVYDYKPQYLQSSLRHSMTYIYDVEMDTWDTWREFLGI
ncbi:hypothetical protein KGF56_002591 [Candida oxycetoniae]|uniref:Peroxisomal membrane protein 4 n=1 Tax=Candida oxycetoniae TaxID=497107 RepID=A0AAI9SXX2_9ASCO|nr:uncharacterized protein KGF56_002591 [Candida oxycetoniae]KAI3404596.2 hypothetical protein KGF56_002591 [Candida oxycetoniae]